MHHRFARLSCAALVAALAACATMGTGGGTTDTSMEQSQVPATQWPIRTFEHVDLWLHGFAMFQDDTTLVPFFRRAYKAQMNDLKRRANVTTQLDANVQTLRARFSQNPALVNAQFIPMYFGSLDEMVQALELFDRADGDPQRASSREMFELIQLLAGYFPTAPDRQFARLFVQSIRDENNRFYRAYWDQQQRERAPVVTAVTSQWNTYRARLEKFLNNTSQAGGEVVLALPLDGEGRTLTAGKRRNSTVVTFPQTESAAAEAVYVIAHEVVGQIVQTAVSDNVTPTDTRQGLADRYIAAGTVRGGAMLLQKVAPELVAGYQAYYLRSAGRRGSSFETTFQLPVNIRDAISRQIDVVLGGI